MGRRVLAYEAGQFGVIRKREGHGPVFWRDGFGWIENVIQESRPIITSCGLVQVGSEVATLAT